MLAAQRVMGAEGMGVAEPVAGADGFATVCGQGGSVRSRRHDRGFFGMRCWVMTWCFA